MKTNPRYLRGKRIKTLEEAKIERAQNLQFHWENIKDSAREFLKEFFSSIKQTEEDTYKKVYPGDPGYENAEVMFDPSSYQGEMKWENAHE